MKNTGYGTLMMITALAFFLETSSGSDDINHYLSSIPAGALPDPHGRIHTTEGKLTRPIVAIFSVPNLSQGSIQEKWAKELSENPETKLPDDVGLYLIEDMKEATFKKTARKEMQKQYKSGDNPIVLIDENGTYRKKFRVPKGETCVLIYNHKNQLQHVQRGKATPEALAKVKKVVHKLVSEN